MPSGTLANPQSCVLLLTQRKSIQAGSRPGVQMRFLRPNGRTQRDIYFFFSVVVVAVRPSGIVESASR